MQKTVHRSTKYIINGQEYDRLEDVPEPHRKYLVDQNKNGIPDLLEHMVHAPKAHVIDSKHEHVVVETRGEHGKAVRAPVQGANELTSNMDLPEPSAFQGFNVRVFVAYAGVGALIAVALWFLLSR